MQCCAARCLCKVKSPSRRPEKDTFELELIHTGCLKSVECLVIIQSSCTRDIISHSPRDVMTRIFATNWKSFLSIPLSSIFMFLVESKQEYWRIYPGHCDDIATLQWCHNADTGPQDRGPGHYSRLFIKGIKPVVCVRLCHTFSAARAALWAGDKGNNSIFTSQYLHRPLVRRVCWPHCAIVPAHRVQCHQPGLYSVLSQLLCNITSNRLPSRPMRCM